MRKRFSNIKRKVLFFKRWSRNSYASFVSMHREVRICSLCSNVADRMFAKQTSFHGGVLSSQATSYGRYTQDESERAEAIPEDALMEELRSIALKPQLRNDYIRQVSDSVRNNSISSCLLT